MAVVNCRSILAGLASNETLEGVELNLSSNALGSAGCQVLESIVADIRCLFSLDVSDNGRCPFYTFDRLFDISLSAVFKSSFSHFVFHIAMPCVCPGNCRIGPIHFVTGWLKSCLN